MQFLYFRFLPVLWKAMKSKIILIFLAAALLDVALGLGCNGITCGCSSIGLCWTTCSSGKCYTGEKFDVSSMEKLHWQRDSFAFQKKRQYGCDSCIFKRVFFF